MARPFKKPEIDGSALIGFNDTVKYGEVIRQYRESANLTQPKLGEILGVATNTVRNWELGKFEPNITQMRKLCTLFNLSIAEMLNLPGNNDLSFDEQQLIDSYRRLSDVNQRISQRLISTILDEQEKAVTVQDATPKIIPLMRKMKVFDLPASAGYGDWLEHGDYTMMSFPETEIPDGTDFGVRVDGDSMLPRYNDGQIAWVQETRTLYDGEIGIFIVDGDAFIKQFRPVLPEEDEVDDYRDSEGIVHNKIVLVSLNEKYDDRVISPLQQIYIVGRVLN